jgi:hypothetical protein
MRPRRGRRVLDGYARATRNLDAWEGSGRHTETRGPWTVTAVDFGNTDAGVQFELFERPGRPRYLRLTLSNGA